MRPVRPTVHKGLVEGSQPRRGWETAIQNHVPHDLLARVSSWDILTSFVGMPLGQAMAGVLTDRFGTHRVLTACAAVILVAGVGPLAVRGTRRLRWEPEPAELV